MENQIKKLKDFLAKCTDESMRASVKKRIEVLEKRKIVQK
jgi:hypothetical protein